MSAATLPLVEVDGLEIISLMDNFYDATLSGNEFAHRPHIDGDAFTKLQPRAEHGFSILVTVFWDGKRESVLFDTGITPNGVLHNMIALRIEPTIPKAIVLSHGHPDHTGGLRALLRHFDTDVPVHIHPDACLNRRTMRSNGRGANLPGIDCTALVNEQVNLITKREPSLLLDDHVLLTGEVARTTDFERGLPFQQADINGEWNPDPDTKDDQSLVIHVRDKGLVVLTGCGHAGLVNILRYAEQLTGVDVVYGVIGGFHLGGPAFEPIIPHTIEELEQRVPQIIVPCHCTGWRASQDIATALPWAFTPNSVGTTYRL